MSNTIFPATLFQFAIDILRYRDWLILCLFKVQKESHELQHITDEDDVAERDLHVTEDDLLEAKALAATYTLEEVREVGGYQKHSTFFTD